MLIEQNNAYMLPVMYTFFFIFLVPALEKDSISKTAMTNGVFVTMPLQTHWFAISLYNIWTKFKREMSEGALSPCVIREKTFTVDIDTVADTSAMLKNKHSKDFVGYGFGATLSLQSSEMYYSTLVSLSLSKLMSSCSTIDVAHQVPVRKRHGKKGNPDTADIAGIRLANNTHYETVFVSDLTVSSNMEIADNQTALYAKYAAIDQSQQSEHCVLILGLSGTRPLWVFLLGNREIWGIPIISDVCFHDKPLLATLSIGLQSLGSAPIYYQALTSPIPFKDENVTPLKKNEHNRTYLRTLHDGSKKVVKFFDNLDEARLSNVHIIRTAGVNVELKEVTDDKRISYISYDYYDGDHKPQCLYHFHNIVCMLDKLHSAGYVHGDVRLANLVFGNDGKGYLIDFDLAGLEGTRYPRLYERHFDVRHEHAIAGMEMCKSHDRYSLAIIVHKYCPEATDVVKNIRSDVSLSIVAAMFKLT